MIDFLLWGIAAYLLGSIPFGLVLTWMAGYGDIRKIGSGNIGATNVLRTGNKFLAVMTLILDIGKGALAVLVVKFFEGSTAAAIAGFFALIGHLYPIWLKFKGGKGVATTLGTMLALSPPVGLIACGSWLLTAIISRISSLSALVAMITLPISAIIFEDVKLAGICLIITIIVWWKHKANIERLLNKTEPQMSFKK